MEIGNRDWLRQGDPLPSKHTLLKAWFSLRHIHSHKHKYNGSEDVHNTSKNYERHAQNGELPYF